MNAFDSLDHLQQVFTSGGFTLPDTLTVAGFSFHLSSARSHEIPDMVNKGKKEFVIYSIDAETKQSDEWKAVRKQEPQRLFEWIIFIWAIDSTLSIRPARVTSNTPARARTDLESASTNLKENKGNIITDTVQIKFVQFNKVQPGKTDTGANMSSLHCEYWKINSGKNMVEFRSSLLSNNTIRTELLDQVAIKTSEGSEYRPIIALDIMINGKVLQNIKFNLNDRSQMQDKILVGQNILEKGKFLVDPLKQQDTVEDVDWDELQSLYSDVVPIEESVREPNEQTDELYQAMLDSDVTMSDLAHHILTRE